MPCFGVDESNTGDEVTEGNSANNAKTERWQAEEDPEDGSADESGRGEGDAGDCRAEGVGGGRCRPQRPPTNWAGRASTSTAAGEDPADLNSRQREMSMRRSWARKKSVPRMGFLTSARINTCTTRKPGKERGIFFFPYVWIEDPLAARSLAADLLFFCAEVAGKTETSAPLSTRKERLCL